MRRYCFLSALVLAFACLTLANTTSKGNEQRIAGGHEVDISMYPHQVSLRVKYIILLNTPYIHLCGGSIIAASWILTAAHCVVARVPSQIQVVAGTNYRTATDGIIVPVAKIIMHEYYNGVTLDNDIALLRLGAPLPLNNFTIKAIELGDTKPLNGALATITGWGRTSPNDDHSDTLRAVQVPIVSNELCNEDYSEETITDAMLCAGVRGEGGKDACEGDSGGPLIIHNKQFGVVSWGYACALPDYPGVHANVPYLLPWVKAKLKEAQYSVVSNNFL